MVGPAILAVFEGGFLLVVIKAVSGLKLGHMKNALFGVLTIAMYTYKTPKSVFFI